MHLDARKFPVFLVAAALISASVYVYSFGLTHPLSTLRLQPTLPKWNLKDRYAYATFLGPPTSKYSRDNLTSTNQTAFVLRDPYFISTRLLNYQINHAEKTRTILDGVSFLVLVLPKVPASQVAVLEAEGAIVVPIEPIDLPDAFDKNFIEGSRFRDVLAKLRLWELTNYEKILYLDADSFLLANLDDIFTDPDLSMLKTTLHTNETREGKEDPRLPETYLMAASTDTYGDQTPWEIDPDSSHPAYLCACFMLISPSINLFNYYISVLSGPDAPPNAVYPEQDLLIYAHRAGGPMPWRRIPIVWNANDGEMNDELALMGGVKSLHVKGWEDAEGGNVGSDKYKGVWRGLVEEMEKHYQKRNRG